jgi:dUTPase
VQLATIFAGIFIITISVNSDLVNSLFHVNSFPYSPTDTNLVPWTVSVIDTGLRLNIPEGMYAQIAPRSSLSLQLIQTLGRFSMF